MIPEVFLPWLGWMLALNLMWEVVQMPLYTLPPAPFPFFTAYSILHCTIGDGLIASALYVGTAFIAGRRWPAEAPLRGLAVLLPFGLAYTAYSEWRNVYIVGSWGYSTVMPTIFGVGLTPLAQWLVLPLVATWLAWRRSHHSEQALLSSAPRPD